jgi:hypothetical protein
MKAKACQRDCQLNIEKQVSTLSEYLQYKKRGDSARYYDGMWYVRMIVKPYGCTRARRLGLCQK